MIHEPRAIKSPDVLPSQEFLPNNPSFNLLSSMGRESMAPVCNNDQVKIQFPIIWESFNTPMTDPKLLFGSGPINDCKKKIRYRWYCIPRSSTYYFFEALETPKRQYLQTASGVLDLTAKQKCPWACLLKRLLWNEPTQRCSCQHYSCNRPFTRK